MRFHFWIGRFLLLILLWFSIFQPPEASSEPQKNQSDSKIENSIVKCIDGVLQSDFCEEISKSIVSAIENSKKENGDKFNWIVGVIVGVMAICIALTGLITVIIGFKAWQDHKRLKDSLDKVIADINNEANNYKKMLNTLYQDEQKKLHLFMESEKVLFRMKLAIDGEHIDLTQLFADFTYLEQHGDRSLIPVAKRLVSMSEDKIDNQLRLRAKNFLEKTTGHSPIEKNIKNSFIGTFFNSISDRFGSW